MEVLIVPSSAGTAALEIRGAISARDASSFRRAIESALATGASGLVLVLHQVPYIAGAAFQSLVELAEGLHRHGGSVFLVEPPAKVKLMVEKLGASGWFHFETSVEAALSKGGAKREGPRLLDLHRHREFSVGPDPVLLGSDPTCTIVLRDPRAGARHAEVRIQGDQVLLRDLCTGHGTWVGDRKIEECALRAGDTIRIGSARFLFLCR